MCVESVAPAFTASAIWDAFALVCPMLATTPWLTTRSMKCGVSVHSGESIHLQIDKTGCDVDLIGRRREKMVHAIDHTIEGNLGMFTRYHVDAVTFHKVTGLYTSFPQGGPAK